MKKKNDRVIAFGVFDLLHPGHIAFLAAAAKHGSLTVIVTPDAKVKKEKGSAPFFTERERLEMVRSLKYVHRAVLGDRGTAWSVVRRLQPAVIAVGHDQRADHPFFLAQLAALKPRPRIVRIPAKNSWRYSSGRIKLEIHKLA